MSDQPIPLTDAELAEKRRYVASRVARDHWGAAELAHVDHEAVWLATVDEVEIERDRQIANGMDLARRLAAAESSAAQALREREDLEGAARALVVAVRMHNAMCRAVGITRAHGPDRWPEERRLSDLLGMDPPTASLPTEESA